jgi:outer membrane lipoprotein SlyB
MKPSRFGSILPICFLLAVASCAGPRPKPVAAAAPSPAGNVSYGTILVVRQAEAAPGVLAALGQAAAADDPAVEFIVREDDGQVISVVQPGGSAFTPGERVMILHGAATRLAAATEE